MLQFIALGHRNGEIAHQLDVALDTVKRHVANICKKFQVHGRRAVIQRAYEHGMLKALDARHWQALQAPPVGDRVASQGG